MWRKILVLGLFLFLLSGCTQRPTSLVVNTGDVNNTTTDINSAVTGVYGGNLIDANANIGDILLDIDSDTITSWIDGNAGTSGTDTNAATECASYEFLDGNGTCTNHSAYGTGGAAADANAIHSVDGVDIYGTTNRDIDFVAGANMTITPDNDANTITFVSTGGSTNDTNAATECASGEFLDGNGTCTTHAPYGIDISFPDTNAETICASYEFLDGNGECTDHSAYAIDTTIPDTNAETACASGEFLDGNGTCTAHAPYGVDIFYPDTNAETICASYEFLDGNGECTNHSAYAIDTTISDTNAATGCDGNTFLNGDNICVPYTTSETYFPSYIITTSGTDTNNNVLPAIFLYDTNSYTVQEDAGAAPLTVDINFSGVNKLDSINLREQYLGGLGHEIYFEVYNIVENNWEIYLVITDQPALITTNVTIFDSSSHIDADGNVQVRFRHTQNGNINHFLLIDWMQAVKGVNQLSNTEHDSLSGRDSNVNHPWAVDKRDVNGYVDQYTSGNLLSDFNGGNYFSNYFSAYDLNAYRGFFNFDLNAAKLNAYDVNVGSGNIIHNDLTYSLTGLNTDTNCDTSTCASTQFKVNVTDAQSSCDSNAVCSIDNDSLGDWNGANWFSNYFSAFDINAGRGLFEFDLNATKLNAFDVNVGNNIVVGNDLNVAADINAIELRITVICFNYECDKNQYYDTTAGAIITNG